jgi:hypothetical protein
MLDKNQDQGHFETQFGSVRRCVKHDSRSKQLNQNEILLVKIIAVLFYAYSIKKFSKLQTIFTYFLLYNIVFQGTYDIFV